MTRHRLPIVAAAMGLGAGAIWSLGAVAARKADRVDAFQYLIWRSVGIIVVIEVVAKLHGKRSQLVRAYTSGRTMLVANVMLLTASLGFVYAVKTTTAANAAFLGSTTPVFGVIAARIFLHERFNKITIVSICVAFVGLFVTVAGDLQAGNMVGNLAALSSAIGFSGYAVCVRSDPDEDWSPVLPGYGVLMIAICAIVSLAKGNTLLPPASDTAYALVHGAVFIVVGTVLFNVASRQIPAAAMTVFAQTEMVLVPVWSITFLSERPPATTWIGGGIILSAILGKAIFDATTTHTEPVPESEPLLQIRPEDPLL
jgi:drug/metabolite transporter, DME family